MEKGEVEDGEVVRGDGEQFLQILKAVVYSSSKSAMFATMVIQYY